MQHEGSFSLRRVGSGDEQGNYYSALMTGNSTKVPQMGTCDFSAKHFYISLEKFGLRVSG
jgi:hypothetical protein